MSNKKFIHWLENGEMFNSRLPHDQMSRQPKTFLKIDKDTIVDGIQLLDGDTIMITPYEGVEHYYDQTQNDDPHCPICELLKEEKYEINRIRK